MLTRSLIKLLVLRREFGSLDMVLYYVCSCDSVPAAESYNWRQCSTEPILLALTNHVFIADDDALRALE